MTKARPHKCRVDLVQRLGSEQTASERLAWGLPTKAPTSAVAARIVRRTLRELGCSLDLLIEFDRCNDEHIRFRSLDLEAQYQLARLIHRARARRWRAA